jgi:hypothetical protein
LITVGFQIPPIWGNMLGSTEFPSDSAYLLFLLGSCRFLLLRGLLSFLQRRLDPPSETLVRLVQNLVRGRPGLFINKVAQLSLVVCVLHAAALGVIPLKWLERWYSLSHAYPYAAVVQFLDSCRQELEFEMTLSEIRSKVNRRRQKCP